MMETTILKVLVILMSAIVFPFFYYFILNINWKKGITYIIIWSIITALCYAFFSTYILRVGWNYQGWIIWSPLNEPTIRTIFYKGFQTYLIFLFQFFFFIYLISFIAFGIGIHIIGKSHSNIISFSIFFSFSSVIMTWILAIAFRDFIVFHLAYWGVKGYFGGWEIFSFNWWIRNMNDLFSYTRILYPHFFWPAIFTSPIFLYLYRDKVMNKLRIIETKFEREESILYSFFDYINRNIMPIIISLMHRIKEEIINFYSKSSNIICSNCGSKNQVNSKFCSKCGARIESVKSLEKICSKCGAKNSASSNFCNNCGSKLEIQKKLTEQEIEEMKNKLNEDYIEGRITREEFFRKKKDLEGE